MTDVSKLDRRHQTHHDELRMEVVTDRQKRSHHLVFLLKGGDPATGSPAATLLRLHPSHEPHRRTLPPCRVSPGASSAARSRDVTGGVYKTRERIHRCVLISDY